MSYRNPKYTYVSQQPAFSQMQQDITGAAKTIADKKAKALEAEKKKGELISKLSSTASAKHVRDTLGASPDDFTDYGRGVVENYFKGSGKKVGELTIATQGPNAKCKVDGNCEELQLELAKLQEKPKQVKSMLETLVSELDWQSIENFDESQNPELMAVSSIMQGIGEFAKEPYGYEMRDGAGGSIDIVFKGPESMFPGDDNNNPGEYIINSKELEAATGPGGASLFNNTQSASVNQGNVMKNTEIIQGATYDDNGNYTGGGQITNIENYIKFGTNTDGKRVPTSSSYIKYSDGKGGFYYAGVIDKDLVKEDIKLGVSQTLNENFGFGSQGGILDGQVRTYWNKVLMSKSWAKNLAKNYDETKLREVFGDQNSSVEELQTRWGDVFTNWSTKEDLTEDQLAVFKELYLEQQAQSYTMAIQNHPTNRVNIDVTNLADNTIDSVLETLPGGTTPPNTEGDGS
jgi:hypothetical protein